MRNLLGRLNARSTEELTRIAVAWRVSVNASDRAGQIGQLYRALIDPRTVRDAWEFLDEQERTMIRLLAIGIDVALTLEQLSRELAWSEADVRRIATQLYHKGMLAREGDDEPLPVGVAPRLFLPRELAQLFRRIQDEIDAGDLSTTPLRVLLSLLDDTEIEEAGQIWGLKVIPGLRDRNELSNSLLERVNNADRVAHVAATRRPDATAIWQRLRAEETGTPVRLEDAAAAAGLNGDNPIRARRLRDALAELERALLVWHTYRKDGSRWLFIPTEIRTPPQDTTIEPPTLEPLINQEIEAQRWRSPHALAWDLLTLVRELSRPQAPRLQLTAELPRSWERQINQRMWIRGTTGPPEGYLSFLLALGVAEGLLNTTDADTSLQVAPTIRAWRDVSFFEQMSRLRQHWLAAPTWIEGVIRGDVAIWGVDWRRFRQRLLMLLGKLEPDTWYSLGAVAQWCGYVDPDLLGATIAVATARYPGPGDELEKRRAIITDIVGITLATAGDWCDIVQFVPMSRQAPALRVTTSGYQLSSGAPADSDQSASRLWVESDLTIRLIDPTPLQIWSVSAFAEVKQLGEESQYQLTPDSVAAALEAGFELQQITTFLTRQQDQSLPPEVEAHLLEWSRIYRPIEIQPAYIVVPKNEQDRVDITRVLQQAGFETTPIGNDLIIRGLGLNSQEFEQMLLACFRDAGFSLPALRSNPLHGRITRRSSD